MPANSSPSLARFYLLDIARFAAFYTIVIFHLTYALWAPDGWTAIPILSPWTLWLEIPARVFAFSGFTVLFISFFLIGFRSEANEKLRRLLSYLPWLTLGWILTVEVIPDWWDIYPFLLVSTGAIYLVNRMRAPPKVTSVLFGILLLLPFWRLEYDWPGPTWLRVLSVGACQSRVDLGEWPLLPWMFFPLLAFSLGRFLFPHRQRLMRLQKSEMGVWLVTVLVFSPWIGGYYSTPLGDDFGCFMFRPPILSFLAQLIPLLLVVRLALVSAIDQRLVQFSVIQRLSRSPVNRRFFLVYFLHYPAIQGLATIIRYFGLAYQPWILAAAFVMIGLVVESLTGVLWRRASENLSTT